MGYGIKLLNRQSASLPMILAGTTLDKGLIDIIKERAVNIDEAEDKLFRLSGFTIEFIGSCKTLFRILTSDDDDDWEFWDNIYDWKFKYYNMDWEELKPIVEDLIQTFSKSFPDEDDEDEKKDCLDCIKTLHSIAEITTIFQIN